MINQINEYTLLKSLGMGGFGEVFLAQSPTEKKYAIKKILINKRDREDVKKEATLSITLQHQNIIKTQQFFLFDTEKYLIIVMEYCPDGNLDELIGNINQAQAQKIMVQIIQGLAYLHNKGIIHRDIKPENILMNKGIAKIADLGLARLIRSSGASTMAGTHLYLAPEMFKTFNYHNSADIWSLGITFLQLLIGDRVYNLIDGMKAPAERQDFPPLQLLNKIQKESIRVMIKEMLNKDPEKRPSANELLNFLNGKLDKQSVLACKLIKNGVIIRTGTFTQPTTLEAIENYDCSFIWASHENYYGGNTSDIVAEFGNTNKATLPYGGKCGWKGGAYMIIAIHPQLSKKIKILTGTYSLPTQIPIPEGFQAQQCKFFWLSQENYYGGMTGDVVFGFGNTKNAGMPYSGKGGWKSGVWMVIAYKADAPIEVITGKHQLPLVAPIPKGSVQSKFFWGSEQNYYGGNTKDVVPMYGVTQEVKMPYGGKCGWKGGAWMSIGILDR